MGGITFQFCLGDERFERWLGDGLAQVGKFNQKTGQIEVAYRDFYNEVKDHYFNGV